MKKGITLRQFVENCELQPFEVITDAFPDLSGLDWVQQYEAFQKHHVQYRRALSVSKEKIYMCLEAHSLRRVGKKIFKQRIEPREYIYITPTTLSIGKNTTYRFIKDFLSLLGIDWFRDIPERILEAHFKKESVLRAVLTKKIYSEETFYRFLAARCYGMKDASWRTIKKYCNLCYVCRRPVSIFDLVEFTKNVDESVEVLTNTTTPDLYEDMLRYAVQLNQVIDFNWSRNRLEAEHQNQIETVNAKELEHKDATPLYEQVVETDAIKLLNNEKEVFMEGRLMHHCVYNCYFGSMKQGTFMAFHMKQPEECTFSIRHENGKLTFDQIHLKYNAIVKPETKQIALDFMEKNADALVKSFKAAQLKAFPYGIQKAVYNNELDLPLFDVVDLPY